MAHLHAVAQDIVLLRLLYCNRLQYTATRCHTPVAHLHAIAQNILLSCALFGVAREHEIPLIFGVL